MTTKQTYDVLRATGPIGLAKAWTRGVELEQEAINQIANCSRLPFIHKHIAVMPDAHAGCGSTVGTVIPTRGAVIPAAVGVDIGCGMMAGRLNLRAEDLPDNLRVLRSAIEHAVPHGRTDYGGPNDTGSWTPMMRDTTRDAYRQIAYARWKSGLMCDPDWLWITEKHPKLLSKVKLHDHLGTLGTGNHFIELCLDENQNVWLMLHSGSRGIGNRIGRYFIELAKQDMKTWFINVPDKDLAYLPQGTEHFDDYIKAVGWAQEFAKANRQVMFLNTLVALRRYFGSHIDVVEGPAINCHHNYVEMENHFGKNVWVTRKGAVRAREGDLGIIPGSMGAKSFIVRGKGNPESFCSCSHGAGRKMSRTRARGMFTVEDHEKATEGVECRKDRSVIDETPAAYKDIDAVMAAQSDLVDIVHTLKQVVCVKG